VSNERAQECEQRRLIYQYFHKAAGFCSLCLVEHLDSRRCMMHGAWSKHSQVARLYSLTTCLTSARAEA
jgi:hypothetical protein